MPAQELLGVRAEPALVPRLAADRTAVQPAHRLEKLVGVLGSYARDGGSWTSSGPRREPSPTTSSRNTSRSTSVATSAWSCVIARGTFTAKRKCGGTEAAQRSYTPRRCCR
jgi:hypothetical protein